jgi:hypothetical protein
MNSRRWYWTTVLIGSMSLFIAQFQNCSRSSAITEGADFGGEVRVVDDWSAGKVSLVGGVLQAQPSDATIKAEGFCDRQAKPGDALVWEIRSLADEHLLVRAGQALCERGGFLIEISDLGIFNCDEAYDFEVRGPTGDAAQAVLIRNCSGS